MSVLLKRDDAEVSLPDPAPGYALRVMRRQATGRTAGGGMVAYDKGIQTLEAEPLFESLTDTERDALEEFFQTAVQGCLGSFVYTDAAGVAWTARLLAPRLEFFKVCADVWDVRLRMELR